MSLLSFRVTNPAGEQTRKLADTALRETACSLPLTAAVYVASGSLLAGAGAAILVVCLRRVISALRAPRP